jgi:hypothetical protein
LVRPAAISEGELRAQIDAGQSVSACLVVVDRASLRGALDFIPFLRCSWSEAPLAVALYRGKGLRGWSDFRTLLEWLRERGYAGPVTVVERSDALLHDWGVTLPG